MAERGGVAAAAAWGKSRRRLEAGTAPVLGPGLGAIVRRRVGPGGRDGSVRGDIGGVEGETSRLVAGAGGGWREKRSLFKNLNAAE